MLFHRDPRWLGADAAFSVDLGGDRILWLFGDSFIATSDAHVRRASHMVRNSIAIQRGRDPSRAEIDFFWKPGPASWLAEQGETWFWPQHGLRIPGGPLILFWSRLHATPGQGLGFMAEGWVCVAIDNPDESPEAWVPRRLEPGRFPAGILPAQGLMLEGDQVLGLAIREPGDHAGFGLRIVAAALARGDLEQLELWDGHWTRASDCSAPRAILADAAPESSLHLDRKLGRYVHLRSLGFGATTLALETAEQWIGPWSAPVEVYRPPESDRSGAFVYAGKAHPELEGADIVATYASNSFDFATLVADASLYYPRFVRITILR
ncbi:MAG TPA: hypothetical protein VK843_11040 [Planctomycetota bacterium]|nr:hypothetical protein [Planctomycetota bacterium]